MKILIRTLPLFLVLSLMASGPQARGQSIPVQRKVVVNQERQRRFVNSEPEVVVHPQREAVVPPSSRTVVADTVSFSESSLKGNITISLKIFEDGEEISHVEFQTINELSQVRVMVPTSSDAISNLEFVSFISPVGSDHYRVQFSYTGEMWSSVDNGGRVGESFSWSSKVEVEKGKEEVLMRDGSITYTLKAGDELQKLGPLGLEE